VLHVCSIDVQQQTVGAGQLLVTAMRYGSGMTSGITYEPIAGGPKRRHEARVQRFSVDPALLSSLDGLSISDTDVPDLVLFVCSSFGVEAPRLKFHARRSPYTGATEQPRWMLVENHGESEVRRIESGMRVPFAAFGAIRLGRMTTLMTLAHELGHHLVFSIDPTSTPAHGKRWVQRFDESAGAIQRLL
jgi:hypothetical protein